MIYKSKLTPFRILVHLLYGQNREWMQIDESGLIAVDNGKAALDLRVTTPTLKRAFRWLGENSYLEGMKLTHNRTLFRFSLPPNLTTMDARRFNHGLILALRMDLISKIVSGQLDDGIKNEL